MYIQISRSVLESFKDAYQLFGDIWAPIAEACINLLGSILLGYLWGLNGILIGVNLSLIIIILIWKPYYIFHFGMKLSVIPYYISYIMHFIVLFSVAIFVMFIISHFNLRKDDLIANIHICTIGMLLYTIITFSILFITTKGMRMFTNRIKNIMLKKI